MGNKVLHLIRKNTQLKASFINNQIKHHKGFRPFIAIKIKRSKENDGGFANFDLNNYSYLYLSEEETKVEKFRDKTTKTLSKRQLDRVKKFIGNNQLNVCHFHYGTDCGVYAPLLKKLTVPSVV